MTEPINALIEALRLELQEYGEMLARLDQQQGSILRRAADDILASVSAVQDQGEAIQRARQAREALQRRLADFYRQPGQATLAQLEERVPADYRPLLRALVEENNQLLTRVQQRARQNHVLLRRSLELMQNLLQTLIPTGNGATYDGCGHSVSRAMPSCALYEAAG